MSGPLPGATRDEVLAWMRTTGKGYKAAARNFGVSLSTVKSWAQRLARKGDAAPGGAAPQRGAAPQAKRATQSARKTDEGAKDEGGQTPSLDGSRARIGRPPARSLAEQRERVKADLRLGIEQRAWVLAQPSSLLHKEQVKIGVTLERMTEALASVGAVFTDQEAPATSEQLTRRLTEVFGAPAEDEEPDEARKLIEIAGGRA